MSTEKKGEYVSGSHIAFSGENSACIAKKYEQRGTIYQWGFYLALPFCRCMHIYMLWKWFIIASRPLKEKNQNTSNNVFKTVFKIVCLSYRIMNDKLSLCLYSKYILLQYPQDLPGSSWHNLLSTYFFPC